LGFRHFHATELLAALAALMNDVEPMQLSPKTQKTNYILPPLLELTGKGLRDVNAMTGIREVRQSMRLEEK
jgi:hypothetical protein